MHPARLGSVLLAALALLPASALAEARLLGLNVHQSADVGLAVTQGCGGHVVRIDFNWFNAEPSQGAYDWSLFDPLVDAARAKGFTVLATAGYTPPWASSGDTDGNPNNDVPVAGTYDAFLTAAVQHFAGRVDHWELWNEPNLSQFFEGTAQDYVSLILQPGAAAVHAQCASCLVLGPDVATVGSNYADWMKAALTQAGASIDIVSGHDYAVFDDMGGGGFNPDFFSKLDHHRVFGTDASILYQDPLSLYESMQQYGAADKPFWLTETGYEATYGDSTAMQTQAHFAQEVLDAMVTRPWWQATVFYEAFDVPGQPYHWGFALQDPDASTGYDPKPVCGVLANPPDFDASVVEAGAADAADAGTDATVPFDGGAGVEAGISPEDAASGADAAPAGSSAQAVGGGSSGCSCRAASTPGGPVGALVGLALLFAARLRKAFGADAT